MAIGANDNHQRCLTTLAVGCMCFALALWMISMANAAWYDKAYPYGTASLLPLAILLGVVGIFAYLHGRSLDAVVFFGGTRLLWSAHAAALAAATRLATPEPTSYEGWYWAVWTVCFGYFRMGSFRAGTLRRVSLLGLSISLGAFAVYAWASQRVFDLISGYVGLVSFIIGLIISASDMTYVRRGKHSPNGDRAGGHAEAT